MERKGRLEDKVCIITGAVSGIGHATALRFAEEGAILSLCDIQYERLLKFKEELEKEFGREVMATKCDISVYEDVVNVVDSTVAAFGRIDVMVNNAGVVDYHVPITRCTNEYWDYIMGVDMTPVFWFCREVLRYMEPAGYGSIVNVSSEGGVLGNCGYPYSAAKMAIISMTKNLALQFNMTRIRCNAIAPGTTPTELNSPDKDHLFHKDYADHCFKGVNHEVPQCDPVDQANAILYFACDESKSTTGQVLLVDHGETL